MCYGNIKNKKIYKIKIKKKCIKIKKYVNYDIYTMLCRSTLC